MPPEGPNDATILDGTSLLMCSVGGSCRTRVTPPILHPSRLRRGATNLVFARPTQRASDGA
jgi:hypothetical protein